MKRKAVGIIYENNKSTMAPNRDYGIDKNGSVRLKDGRKRMTKGMRDALKAGKP